MEIAPTLDYDEQLTHRFSPGYGDLNMNVTNDILSVLKATERLGVSMTQSQMMVPMKSVTAIIGVQNITVYDLL